MKNATILWVGLSLLAAARVSPAGDKDAPGTFKHRITGLFRKDREADLREAVQKIPNVHLVSIDFDNAEAVFRYAPARAFPGAQPKDIVQHFDNKLRTASGHTLGVKPLRTTPREKLQRIEIVVAGCKCKACELAAYEAVARLDGVEAATASFHLGRVTALLDPAKTTQAQLEAALKRLGVQVKGKPSGG